jgi:calcineurin-like phosphoesterase family protein
MSKVYIVADTHLKHEAMRTYCDRPAGFTERIHINIMSTLQPEDLLIHLGDVGIGPACDWVGYIEKWPCKKILVRGNHDDHHSPTWWLDHGFHSVCDAMIFRGVWVTHKPASSLPEGCDLNLHGHLHNIWHGFQADAGKEKPSQEEIRLRRELKYPWQRLFAAEYTNYYPIEWYRFFSRPSRYQSMGPSKVSEG